MVRVNGKENHIWNMGTKILNGVEGDAMKSQVEWGDCIFLAVFGKNSGKLKFLLICREAKNGKLEKLVD